MANFNFNKVTLGGRITSDPELKSTQQGLPVCSFSVAVNRKGKDSVTDFINCVAWRQNADFVSKYFKKGSSICLTGNLQVRQWNDQQNNKRYSTEVIVEEVYFVDSKADGGVAPQDAQAFQSQPEPKFEEVPGDDDLPF